MLHATSKKLYAYWDRLRDGRAAPSRSEVDPSEISSLLPDTFIAECGAFRACRFRLAGTRICKAFGRELRGEDLLSLWEGRNRQSFSAVLRSVLFEAAAGHAVFDAYAEDHRSARFELLILPVAHNGSAVTRVLGAMSAIDPPAWLGTMPLLRQELVELRPIQPGEGADMVSNFDMPHAEIAVPNRRFRVYQGGADTGSRRLL
jgi:hypothetical protein